MLQSLIKCNMNVYNIKPYCFKGATEIRCNFTPNNYTGKCKCVINSE